jgi:hypothetical protein
LGPIQGLLELLAKIPGVDKLLEPAVKGLNDFRNRLKGIEPPAIEATATVNADESEFDKLMKGISIPGIETPNFDMPDFSMSGLDGMGGKSKLHGVVDISGGAIPGLAGADTVRTATGGADGATGESAAETITRTMLDIATILRRIDSGVSAIAHNAPAIRTPQTLTRMSGDTENAADYRNPRSIDPITQGERASYAYSERVQRLIIEVAAEKGTAARIARAPRDAEIQLVNSGGNA